MLASLSSSDNIDILILSEMALTGYVFATRAQVEPLAEVAGVGDTFRWCQQHARRLHCMVICGYVERGPSASTTQPPALYNAMLVVNPHGDLVCNPRKTFLYETDKIWATPGDGFSMYRCPILQQTIAFGICMDINPYEFIAPFDAFEFATHAVANHADLVLFACAWCDHEPENVTETYPTLSYWAARLTPLTKALQATDNATNCYFVCANRIGEENGTFFVGASCAMSLREPALVAHASRTDECVLRVELPL